MLTQQNINVTSGFEPIQFVSYLHYVSNEQNNCSPNTKSKYWILLPDIFLTIQRHSEYETQYTSLFKLFSSLNEICFNKNNPARTLNIYFNIRKKSIHNILSKEIHQDLYSVHKLQKDLNLEAQRE
mgnify:CR=1 FL=1